LKSLLFGDNIIIILDEILNNVIPVHNIIIDLARSNTYGNIPKKEINLKPPIFRPFMENKIEPRHFRTAL